MPSFDVVCKTDMQEMDNAINQVKKELVTRFDFKESKSTVELEKETITICAEDVNKVNTVAEILRGRLVRRQLDPKCLSYGTMEDAGGGMKRQKITAVQGVNQDLAKKLVKAVKDSKLKVQASIQGDQVRIVGKKRDDLQEAIAMFRGMDVEVPLQFTNFRE